MDSFNSYYAQSSLSFHGFLQFILCTIFVELSWIRVHGTRSVERFGKLIKFSSRLESQRSDIDIVMPCLGTSGMTLYAHARSSRSSISSSFFTKRPLTRSRLFAKFFRTSYLISFFHTRCLRFSKKRSMRAFRDWGEYAPTMRGFFGSTIPASSASTSSRAKGFPLGIEIGFADRARDLFELFDVFRDAARLAFCFAVFNLAVRFCSSILLSCLSLMTASFSAFTFCRADIRTAGGMISNEGMSSRSPISWSLSTNDSRLGGELGGEKSVSSPDEEVMGDGGWNTGADKTEEGRASELERDRGKIFENGLGAMGG